MDNRLKYKRRISQIQDKMKGHQTDSETSSDDEEEEGAEEEEICRTDMQSVEASQEFWNIHKFVKYLQVGNSTVTLIALIGLKDCGLNQEVSQLGLIAAGGVEILLNILRTNAYSCIVGSLQVLEMACKHKATRLSLFHLGGVQVLQGLLSHSEIEVRGFAASVLSRVCSLSFARNCLIEDEGLPVLVSMLELKGSFSKLRAVEGAARAIWVCSISKVGQKALLKGKLLDLIGPLLQTSKNNILIPVVGILERCFSRKGFRKKVEADGHTSYLVRFLQSSSSRLQCLSAQALAKAALLEATRTRLVTEGGLTIIVKLLVEESRSFIIASDLSAGHPARKVSLQVPDMASAKSASLSRPTTPGSGKRTSESSEQIGSSQPVGMSTLATIPDESEDFGDEKSKLLQELFDADEFFIGESDLLEAVTGILWQVSKSGEHVKRLHDLGAVPVLVALLHYEDEKVVTNVVGAIGEVVVLPECCSLVVHGDGVVRLLELLQSNSDKLLLNVAKALDSCAKNGEALDQLLEKEGLRLLWSHLKSPNEKIQASAANAICTCLRQEKEGLAEVVRSLVGGIELLVALLESPCEAVLSSVCAAIARIAADPQNLAIMTDYGAVTCLSKLAVRENDTLRPYLAEAIAACCVSRETGLLFGQAGAVTPLVQYLETNDSKIRRPTCRALYRLSLEPENCVTLHESGAVNLLLEMLGSEDEVVQEAGADCLRNIRLLSLQRCRERDTQNDVFILKEKNKKRFK
ncbi:UNVERIFIED_CONTAM: hypothetical protein RMT77_003111 [Armadillidium vulgare]